MTDQFVQPDPFDLALKEYYATSRDIRRYRALVELGAKAGDPLAQYAMATWYLLGSIELSVPKNRRLAISYLRLSAKSLNRAMYDLAVCKIRGFGVRRDWKGAYALFSRAASQGCLPAMIEKAKCLRSGLGVARNVAAAQRLERHTQVLIGELQALGPQPRGRRKRGAR